MSQIKTLLDELKAREQEIFPEGFAIMSKEKGFGNVKHKQYSRFNRV